MSLQIRRELIDLVDRRELVGVVEKLRPPYSPDLNPIEQIFSKIKSHLCRLAVRTERKLYNAIAKALDAVTPDNCLNCFRNAGYIPQ